MRPEQAGPEGDEIVEQECSAFLVESGNGWLQQIRTRFLNMALTVADREVVVMPWGALRFSLAALPSITKQMRHEGHLDFVLASLCFFEVEVLPGIAFQELFRKPQFLDSGWCLWLHPCLK